MKVIVCGVLLFLVYAAGVLCAGEDSKNMIENSSFEEDYLGNLAMWDTDAYINNEDAFRIAASDDLSHSGKRSLVIVNLVPNDTKVIQWVKVEPDTFYKLSCWIMAEGVSGEGIGASISILGNATALKDFKNTKGEWEYLEIVGKTGSEQNLLPVAVRLGFYGGMSTGLAYFDDIELIKLAEPPAGKVVDFSSDKGFGEIYEKLLEDENITAFSSYLPFFIILGICLVAAAVVLFYLHRKGIVNLSALNRFRRIKRISEINHRKSKRDSVSGAEISSGVDKRKSPRKKLIVTVFIKKISKDGSYDLIELKSENISESGIFLRTEDLALFNIDEEVLIEIKYKRSLYNVGNAQVIRKQQAFDKTGKRLSSGFGLAFISGQKAHVKNLKAITGSH